LVIEARKTRHLDLFSGIGGFAYAAKEVWKDDYETVAFCDIDKFCQAVLRLRFPRVPVYGDIFGLNDIIADSESKELEGRKWNGSNSGWKTLQNFRHNGKEVGGAIGCFDRIDLLTGGFPCQPFSTAGKRRGRGDERHLWPAMLRTIELTKPRWIIAENVRGLLSIEQGVAFEQVCLDLESLGYETRAFLIPACAVNAPHRRDRVWIVGRRLADAELGGHLHGQAEIQPAEGRLDALGDASAEVGDAHDCPIEGLEGTEWASESGDRGRLTAQAGGSDWEQDWPEVATRLCGVDDGLPAGVDGLELSKSKHRIERLKALGNSIVPQVAMEIMRAIKRQDG
jgi:DNA (cytosine-5)-methyltransferase 1